MTKTFLFILAVLASSGALASTADVEIFSMNEKMSNEKPFLVVITGAKAKAAYVNTLSKIAEVEIVLDDKTLDWGGWSKTRGSFSCSKTYLKAEPKDFNYLCSIDLGAFDTN